jgi:hypothetical protein
MNFSDCLSTQKKWEILSSVSWVLSVLVVAIAITMYIKRNRALEQVQADYSNLRRYVLTDGEQAARLNHHIVWLEEQMGSLEGMLRATQDRERQLAEYIRVHDLHDLEVGEEQREEDGREASMFVVGLDEDSGSDDGYEEKNGINMADNQGKGSLGVGFAESFSPTGSGWEPDPEPYNGTYRLHKTVANVDTKLSAHLTAPGHPRSKSRHPRVSDRMPSGSPPRRQLSPEVESELYTSVRSMMEAEEAKSSMIDLADPGKAADRMKASGTNEDGFVEVINTPSPVDLEPPFPPVSDAEADERGEKTGQKTNWTPGEWEMLDISGKDGERGEANEKH